MQIEHVWTKEIDETFDVEQFASNLVDTAIENLKTDGYLQAAVYIATSAQLRCYAVGFSGLEEKDLVYSEIVRSAQDLKARAIVTLNDAYVGHCEDETYEWGQLAANHESEAIFVTLSGPGLENWSTTVRYRREGKHMLFSLPVTERKTGIGLLRDWAKKGQRAN